MLEAEADRHQNYMRVYSIMHFFHLGRSSTALLVNSQEVLYELHVLHF